MTMPKARSNRSPGSLDKPYVGTQAAQRAIAILQIFTDSEPEWSLSEISAQLNLNRTTAYRLVTVLLSAGLVTQLTEGDRYRLGSEVIALGARAMRANPLRKLCQKVLQDLAKSTGEMSTLEVISGSDILIVEEHGGRFLLNASAELGTRWPAYATSSGLAMMAYLPKDQVNKLLKKKLPRITNKTQTKVSKLLEMIEQGKQTGYLVLTDALEPGYVAISSPIRDHRGQALAAISIGGPKERINGPTLKSIGKRLSESASDLSQQIGYRASCH